MKKESITVEGMACGHCEIAVKDAVRRLSGIKKVKASKRKKQAVVEYDEALVGLGEIKEAIAQIGYDVK